MDYSLNDLLAKMGLNELTEQKSLRWHYTDSTNAALGGVAEARLDEDGRYLSVNLVHRLMEADMDTDGTEEERLETVQIEARRIGDSQTYRITKLGFDGTDFAADNDAMLQLGTGLFYARALHINEIMIDFRNGILPDKFFFRYFRTEESAQGAHISVRQFIPGFGKFLGQFIRVLVESSRNRSVLWIYF
jgi:hypothetical protein